MHNYDHKAIEAKWQKRWEESGIYCAEDAVAGKENHYALVEFPYPSGNLHIGHWYAFAVPDIYARYKRMQGYNVLFPIGFDSFGLPAENAAIKNKLDPKDWTYKNIEHMTAQMRSMGNSFDWSRKVITSDPDYYKWTQWLFLQFFKNGLAYRATELANWCPSCNTVLANEQVKNGLCERCGTEVEKREQATWFLKITDYAERLLSDLDALDWPEEIKESQRNWIGKSEGAVLKFRIQSTKSQINSKSQFQNSKVVIVHGCPSDKEKAMSPETRTYDKHWLPWIEKELTKRGCEVTRPLMPTPWQASYSEWKAVLDSIDIDENTVLVGTSCGGAFLTRWLGDTKKKVKGLVLVSPAYKAGGSIADHELPTDLYSFTLDRSIPERVQSVIVYTSNNDPYREHCLFYNSELRGSKLVDLQEHGHFVESDMGTKEFPALLDELQIILDIPTDSGPFGPINACWAIIKTNEGKYLFQKRTQDAPTEPGILALFGGGMDKGETPFETITRELSEELKLDATATGVTVKLHGYLDNWLHPGKSIAVFSVEGVEEESLVLHEGDAIIPYQSLHEYCEDPFASMAVISMLKDTGLVPEDRAITSEVFTTRPDTLFGATYLVFAPEHERIDYLKYYVSNRDEIEAYIKKAKATKDIERTAEGREKTGVKLEGVVAINPGTKEEIPVYIADYVLAHYGTGAIMAVPAHDERDFAFAKKYGLPIRAVISPEMPTHAGALLECRDKPGVFLFQLRNNDKKINPGKVGFFGGTIEEREAVQETLRRELMEELELDVDKAISDNSFIIRSPVTESYVWVQHLKNVDRSSLRLHEGEEILELTLEEVASHKLVTPIVKEIAESMLSRKCYTDTGILVQSADFEYSLSEDAKQKITDAVGGRMQATYRLRDWSLSRQRYWGAPIPIVYDPDGKPHAVPDEHLPWTLPEDVDFTPTGEAPLARSQELKERVERIFGKGRTPEYDTFDAFVDSSWYFLRYCDPHNTEAFADKEKLSAWMPVARYSGGAEHTTMHVLYSRFWQKALFDLGLVADDEPYRQRMNRGQILGPDGKKMSKSKGNVVDPDEHVARVGADTVRMYLAFMGPYNVPGNYPFDLGGVAGMRRFLERIIRLKNSVSSESQNVEELDTYNSETTDSVQRLLHQTIKKVGDDIEAYKFNTAISQLMILVNALEKEKIVSIDIYKTLLRLLAPFAPHLAEELWEQAGEQQSVHIAPWPPYDESVLQADSVTIAVQINGKVRGTFEAPLDEERETLITSARALPSVTKWIAEEPKKVIHVPNKVINFIV